MKQALMITIVTILIGSSISEQATAQRYFSRRSRVRSSIDSRAPVRVTVPSNVQRNVPTRVVQPSYIGQPTRAIQPISANAPTRATPNVHVPGSIVYSWDDVDSRPFSPDWYTAHPEAWQLESDESDPFVPTTSGALALWLGAEDLSTGVATPADALAADLLVRSDDPLEGDVQWMTLGVFALKPSESTAATRVVHLAVDMDGRVRGTLADLLDGHANPLHGGVDKSTFQIAFQIGNEIPVTFSSSVAELTKSSGMMTVYYPGGSSAKWQIVRLGK